MTLSCQTIAMLAHNHEMIVPFRETKLIISGKSAGLSSASYDMTIGHDLVLGVNPSYVLQKFFLKYGLDQDKDWVLKDWLIDNPPFAALAHTEEDLRIPDFVSAQVCDKSSYARVFCSAFNTFVDPGFHGNLTLELVNHGPKPVVFKKGDPIVQILFTLLDCPTERPYRSKYQHQTKSAHGPRHEHEDGTWTAKP